MASKFVSGEMNMQHFQNVFCEMTKRQKYLSQQDWNIWQGKNGFWYVYLPDETKNQKRRLVKKKSRDCIEDEIIKYCEIREENPTIKEVFEIWNAEKFELDGIRANTFERNKQRFNKHFGAVQDMHIKDVTPEWLEKYLKRQIIQNEMKKKSFNQLKSLTAGIFRTAKSQKWVDFSIREMMDDMKISPKIFKPDTKNDLDEVYTKEEIEKIKQYALEKRSIRSLGVLLMFLCACRIGELVVLRKDSFDSEGFQITSTEVRIKKTSGKGYDYNVGSTPKTDAGFRVYPVTESIKWVLEEIEKLNPSGEFLFMENGERLKAVHIRRELEKICKKVNVQYKSPHKIRKTGITIMKDNFIDDKMIERLVGHKDIECTNNYYYFDRKTLHEKREALSGIAEFCIEL